MTDRTCPRCHLPLEAAHDDATACIGALGEALVAARAQLEALTSDLAKRQAQDRRREELHAEAEADLARGG